MVTPVTEVPITSEKFDALWPAIDSVTGFLVPGQERWLFNTVANLPDDATIVEVGSFLGRSTTAMAFACRGTNRKIYAVDTYQGNSSDFQKGLNNVEWQGDNFLAVFEANLARNGLNEFVTPVVGNSSEVGASWDKPIDFIFIDGSHQYEDVVADFEAFFPWVKPGAVIAFHDVLPEWTGPYDAWRKVIRSQLENPSQFFSLAYGRKPYDGAAYTGTVYVIMPVHNRARFTRSCLKTLSTQTLRDRMQVHVVNDGSTDETVKMLKEEFPWVNVIAGDGDLWWTGAVAHALDVLKPGFEPGDFFLLVNNDVYLSPETLEVLVRESMRLNRAAVAPVAICGNDAISTGWASGTTLILNDFEKQHAIMSRCGNTLPVEALFGRCSLYPTEMLDIVGNFDAQKFPHYHGDTDFGLRASKLNLPFVVTGCTCIRVREEDSESTGSHFDFRRSPQTWGKVMENMTAKGSIDNVPAYWRYMSRHFPKGRYRRTALLIWRNASQWLVIRAVLERWQRMWSRMRTVAVTIDAEGGPVARLVLHLMLGIFRGFRAVANVLFHPFRTGRVLRRWSRNETVARLTYYPRALVWLLFHRDALRQKLRGVAAKIAPSIFAKRVR